MVKRIPPHIEARIRASGPISDVEATRLLYEELHRSQTQRGESTTRDLVYGPDPRHRLDVYRPAEPAATPCPLVLFFHGGGFMRGDKAEKANVGRYFASRGYVTVCANYRLAPQHRWPAGAEDVVRAFAWILQHAAQFAADPSRVFLVGESAGAAHVAAATLIHGRTWRLPAAPAGAVLVSGTYNVRLEALAGRQFGIAAPDIRNEAYFGPDINRYSQMSVVELVDAQPFPVLVTYAELDPAQMQVQAGELFACLTTRHRFKPQLSVIAGHNHLSQVFSMDTGDDSLGDPIVRFLQSPTAS